MENLPQFFNFENHKIRVVIINGEPWLVAKDVCDFLQIKNSRDSVSKLDDDEKGVVNIDTLGGSQQMSIINEPGLYSLSFNSNKDSAKRFRRIVCHDILPAIRETGQYIAKPEKIISLKKIQPEFKAGLKIAKDLNLEGNAAILYSNAFIKESFGVDLTLKLMNPLESEVQERYYNPTELGKLLTPVVSGRVVNQRLKAQGLQTQSWEDGNSRWTLTEKGKRNGGKYFDATSKHQSHGTHQQIRWYEKVLKLIS